MAYIFEGKNHVLVYLANYRVGSVATANTILNMGGTQHNAHHGLLDVIPNDAVVVQTVRNHFDVLISFWCKDGCKISFDDYVQIVLDGNHEYLQPDAFYERYGEWNYIMQYDTLQHEWDQICLLCGIPQIGLDPNPKKKARPKTRTIKSLFDSHLTSIVTKRYGKELERIGYGVT